LWQDPKTEHNVTYQGVYGDGLGAGENINIPGRGDHPELYLFRLPVPDCYLTDDHKISIVTMGPKLTDNEIAEIDKLAETYHSQNYYTYYGIKCKRPSLSAIKKLYDVAIDPTPDLPAHIIKENFSNLQLKEMYYKINMWAVDKLKTI